jgi:baculoviral IAP repeat-containing protein 7/8
MFFYFFQMASGHYFIFRNNLPAVVPDIPRIPRMIFYNDRFATFARWPPEKKQSPRDMARSGFFYTGKGDICVCFHCGGMLRFWGEDDNPWWEHAKFYQYCGFNIVAKGQGFINNVHGIADTALDEEKVYEIIGRAIMSDPSLMDYIGQVVKDKIKFDNEAELILAAKVIQSSESKETDESISILSSNISEECVCKICLDKEREIIFDPCRHVVCCSGCAKKVERCPVCRSYILLKTIVYF